MTEDKPVKAWRWPGTWFRQESFWRDVGSRTLAAIFAAGFVYVFALLAGYVGRPNILPVVVFFGTGGIILTLCIYLYFTGDPIVRTREKAFYWVTTAIYSVVIPFLILSVMLWVFY